MPNRLHRYYGAGYLHFITTSCYQRRALLGSRKNRDLFLNVLEQVRRRYRFVIVGYVVMPEHMHLLFGEPERSNPSVVHASSETGLRAASVAPASLTARPSARPAVGRVSRVWTSLAG